MCMTCHRGIDQPAMTERAVGELLGWFLQSRLGEKAWTALEAAPAPSEAAAAARAWLKVTKETPARDLPPEGALREWLSGTPSLLDLFAKDRLRVALGDAKGDGEAAAGDPSSVFRDRHLGGKSFEAGGVDLLAPFAIRRVEWAHPHLDVMVGKDSPHKMEVFGCTACHQGVGRRLDFVRASHNPGSEEQRKRWEKEHAWKPAENSSRTRCCPRRTSRGSASSATRTRSRAARRWSRRSSRATSASAAGREGPPPRPGAGQRPRVEGDRVVAPRSRARPPDDGGRAAPAATSSPASVRTRRTVPGKRRRQAPRLAAVGFDGDVKAPGTLAAAGAPKVGPDLKGWPGRPPATGSSAGSRRRRPTASTRGCRRSTARRHQSFVPVPGPDSKPVEELVVLEPTEKDRIQLDVEVLALATYLHGGQATTPEEKAKYDALYVAPPAGDPALGKKYFYSQNCYACHLGPDDRPGSGLPQATLDRFASRRAAAGPAPDGDGQQGQPRLDVRVAQGAAPLP
jgi:hypothetical protein